MNEQYEGMSLEELRDLYNEKKSAYRGFAGSGRQLTEITRIGALIQALESAEAGGNE